jgi:hypothetical protein
MKKLRDITDQDLSMMMPSEFRVLILGKDKKSVRLVRV